MKRNALGKGLGSLIPSASPASSPPPPTSELKIEVSRIRPNRRQPRQDFDDAAIEELARSLRTTGLLQPVIVRPAENGHYELVAGERRWRAAQRAGIHRIPAVIRDVPDERLLELALIENVQREELNAIEEAEAYRILADDLGLTQQEIAERVGKQRTSVANAIRLLNLPPRVQQMVRGKQISMGHARALLALEDAKIILELAERVAKEGLSVREVEARAKRATISPAGRPGRPSKPMDPNVAAAEQTLQRALATKVRIVGSPTAGRIEIHYKGDEDLDRLYRILLQGTKVPV
ncbi:MAG TPA: ParB/RepB/Spo0J family partition protein [Candidatus Polarisedimenticolaceae bacterium]|nr:ParB/RepB/Spo0J family partition protein [Candidatus Polarisedimenticolaceae bacterium]